ncbi:MAG: Uma2 family endonuclease [Agriterribacter sp.]
MNSAYKILPHYTYDDRLQWEGRWELIDGIPYAMSPSPAPGHQKVAAELRYEFMSALKNSNCTACNAFDPIDYKISDDTVLIPDIVIVCSNIEKQYLDFPPALVVEILSPSTALKDRNTKMQLYEREKVKYYLIVDTDAQVIEIYQLADGRYNLHAFSNSYTFILQNGCSIDVQLNRIF